MIENMKCPHCMNFMSADVKDSELGEYKDGFWRLMFRKCTNQECERLVAELDNYYYDELIYGFPQRVSNNIFQVYPKGSSRPPVPSEVPEESAKDYTEACLVLADSPNASAALSRRCLQNIIRGKEGITRDNLFKEIEDLLEKGTMPPYIKNDLHVIRKAGRMAVHALKNEHTGEIVDVEPEEAERMLGILELLFDFYFVEAAKAETMREKIDKKNKEAKDKVDK